MPRPKRSRVAPSRPAAAPVERNPQQSSATPPAVTQPSRAKTPSSDIYDVSDREKQRMRTRASGSRRDFEVDSEQIMALDASRRRRDAAMDKLDNITSTSSVDNGMESPDIEYSRRESVSATSRPARLTDASGLDLDDSVFANLDDSLEDSVDADTTHQTHQTRSTDTSSFNVGMFRRRPRASSIIGKDDAPIRPSSRGPNTPSISSLLNLGRFKRRQREPSILGTAQKDRAPRPQSVASNYGSVMGDESGPEDESTPLDKTKRHSGAAPLEDVSRESSPALPTRKRKSLEEQTGREKRPALDDGSDEVIHQSIEVDSSPPASPSIRAALRSDVSSTPIHNSNDHDMAPPASSDSSNNASPIVWPPLESLAHRTYARHRQAVKTPELDDDAASNISSPPSLTHSPNYRPAMKTRARRKPAPSPKVTTKDLTSLLPRRRHNARGDSVSSNDQDPYDIESSDENPGRDDDADELSYVDSRAAAAKRKRLAQTSTNGNAKGTNAKGTKSTKKKTAAPAVPASKRKTRVYGRTSDKENEDGEAEGEEVSVELGSEAEEDDAEVSMWDAETSQMMEKRLGVELKNAAKKFKEVDRWELSFEVISSSPAPDVLPQAVQDLEEEEEEEEEAMEGAEGPLDADGALEVEVMG
ncbi:hypothetical protein B0T16DRAFT_492938 [Cercophora newfieldiana]|uniref:Uncharacterized protein n=1 Tax=Cercophora newfieldiana TaxID=92897 RepID=A0AA39Y4N4_9PEZI|nr:hypothetical protein B0T16DRAFT_492938 [Cercophora newfieldiana]